MFILVDDEDRENEGDLVMRRRSSPRRSRSTSWRATAAA
jgi:3,4-dihydroxy-2-butanone 4-phosphate synthase